jgi:hypothetical protein
MQVPVDMWWWLSFFHSGKRCCKVSETLFGWRQHPRQHTRTHGRLSIENLRRYETKNRSPEEHSVALRSTWTGTQEHLEGTWEL